MEESFPFTLYSPLDLSDVASRCHQRCVSSMVRATRFYQPIRLQNVGLHHDDQSTPGGFACSILDSIGIDLPAQHRHQHVSQSLVHASVVHRVASTIAMLHSPELASHWGTKANRILDRHHRLASRVEMVTIMKVRLSIRRAGFPLGFPTYTIIHQHLQRAKQEISSIKSITSFQTYPKAQDIMQFSKIALLLPLVLSSAIATPVREEQLPNQLSVTENGVEEAGNALAKRGFGCPIDYFCNNHVG